MRLIPFSCGDMTDTVLVGKLDTVLKIHVYLLSLYYY
jgi:hypothetical protein